LIRKYGYEIAESKCGFSLTKQPTSLTKYFDPIAEHENVFGIHEVPVAFQDIAGGSIAFVTAIEYGYTAAIMPLAMNIMLGIGLEPIQNDWNIPFPLKKSTTTNRRQKFQERLRLYLLRSLRNCYNQKR